MRAPRRYQTLRFTQTDQLLESKVATINQSKTKLHASSLCIFHELCVRMAMFI